jgi:hypothetical protein
VTQRCALGIAEAYLRIPGIVALHVRA